jgi:hypothetical protein
MPILRPKVPLAHALPVLSAMLSIVAAMLRFLLPGCATNVHSGTKVLTKREKAFYRGGYRMRRKKDHGMM